MVSRDRIARATLLIACAALAAGFAASADAALVQVGDLVLRAEAGFSPQKLPRHSFAPIDFKGSAEFGSTHGGQPPALETAIVSFDRNGLLTTQGLPTCPPGRIRSASPKQAKRLCKGALVGEGEVGAAIDFVGLIANVHAPLSLFNGPKVRGNPSLLAHVAAGFPISETYVVTLPIERRSGAYRYRVTLHAPPIAGGLGALTHVEATIGRHYTFHGRERSYLSARCPTGVLHAHGHFLFDNEVVIDGQIEKPCTGQPLH
jgi:hypothetical protein